MLSEIEAELLKGKPGAIYEISHENLQKVVLQLRELKRLEGIEQKYRLSKSLDSKS